jgi:hypothetical protein
MGMTLSLWCYGTARGLGRAQGLYQFEGRNRQLLEAARADQQLPVGPGVGQCQDAQPGMAFSRDGRHHGHTDTGLHHAADGLKAAQPYTRAHAQPQAFGLQGQVLVQRAVFVQADEVMGQRLRER